MEYDCHVVSKKAKDLAYHEKFCRLLFQKIDRDRIWIKKKIHKTKTRKNKNGPEIKIPILLTQRPRISNSRKVGLKVVDMNTEGSVEDNKKIWSLKAIGEIRPDSSRVVETKLTKEAHLHLMFPSGYMVLRKETMGEGGRSLALQLRENLKQKYIYRVCKPSRPLFLML